MSFISKKSETAVGLAEAKWNRNFKKNNSSSKRTAPEMKIAANESLSRYPQTKTLLVGFWGCMQKQKVAQTA